jgi:hypothetical protein
MSPSKKTAGEAEGSQGAIAGLGLSDVIQRNGANRFSGCVTVQHGDDVGRIFFRDGRIIHSERGASSGQEAFFEIVAWRSGRISLEPNVSTTSRSIDTGPQHLLMEAHRAFDERCAGFAPEPPAPRSGAAPPPTSGVHAGPRGLIARLRSIPGVTYAVLVGSGGACVDDGTFEGEALAGKVAYLAMVGNQLGAVFCLEKLQSAALHGGARHVLFQADGGHQLGLGVGGAEVGAVAAEVRKVLAERA